ncbi:MAG: hypothetical protein methR_P2990 [Methyloprofundus sp.]|nr:MAG: hypothetical protein methR_P2990 [Methyloprofundus sp.]
MNESYRNGLITAEQKSQDDYDKTVISLSGGALGISLIFIKDIIGDSEPIMVWTVITAWVLWALSITSVLISYFLSRLALRKSIIQLDNDNFSEGVGGCAAKATQVFNVISGALFILGIVFLIIFSSQNIGSKTMNDKTSKESIEKKVPSQPTPHCH